VTLRERFAWLEDRLASSPEATPLPRPKDALLCFCAALLVRAAVVAVAASHFPPVDDGSFYHVVAKRIAQGLGYTWLWPDGAVTHAAHYPVGYPALIGLFYALFGPHVGVAMAVNALLGALAAPAAHVVAARVASRGGALIAGLLVAFEPALVAYTPALMTEGVAGALLLSAAAVAVLPAVRSLWVRAGLAGLVMGVTVLVRPQLVVLGPVLGLFAAGAVAPRRRLAAVALVTLTSLAVCLPWTLRNCEKIERCAFVSANGGWNLFIGSSPLGRGGFTPLERIGVPEECRTVFGEGEKDRCFGNAALRTIARAPGAWLALAPKKLGMTFDYGTAAAYYLGASNGDLIGEGEKRMIGAAELVGQRVLVLLGLFALARAPGPRRRARLILAAISALLLFQPAAFLAFVGLVATALLLGGDLFRHGPALIAASVVLATALTHAAFFGASRYALVCLPALAALSGSAWFARKASGD